MSFILKKIISYLESHLYFYFHPHLCNKIDYPRSYWQGCIHTNTLSVIIINYLHFEKGSFRNHLKRPYFSYLCTIWPFKKLHFLHKLSSKWTSWISPLESIRVSKGFLNKSFPISGRIRSCPRSIGWLSQVWRQCERPRCYIRVLFSISRHQHCSLAIRNWRGKFNQPSVEQII